MSTTEPIRRLEDIEKIKSYFINNKEYRNFTMFSLGINTALRISDLLSIKWSDVYNFRTKKLKKYIKVKEKKTGKNTMIILNKSCLETLTMYKTKTKNIRANDYIFVSRKKSNLPISRIQAFRILRKAANKVGISENISCHSLRKTFGYHARLMGADPSILTSIYNHSCYEVTKRYLGISQDDKDDIVKKLNL